MSSIPLTRLLIGLMAVALIGCNGDVEQEATLQAVILDTVSTSTPTPEPTNTAAPTNTPVPPTATATPAPTETPLPPTPTATPPSPTRTAFLRVEDPAGDTVVCDTQDAGADAEVDITAVEAGLGPGTLAMRVWLDAPLESDFSFAVLLSLGGTASNAVYIWETHATELRIGQMDIQTGQLLTAPPDGLAIDHDLSAGAVTFSIPYTTTTALTTTNAITTTTPTLEQFFVASFHTPQVDATKHCDTAGPFDFTADFRARP